MTTCWGLTGGTAGMAAQVMALANAIGVKAEMKNVSINRPWFWLPNRFFAGWLDRFVIPHMLAPGSDKLTPPWPDLVISCGRRGTIAALGLKAYLKGKAATKFIHIQNPYTDPRYFDLVVVMGHDGIRGPNVLETRFALYAITKESLAAAATRFSAQFAAYPKPHVSVLLGGTTHRYRLQPEAMQQVIARLHKLLSNTTGSLLITPSRRTGTENTAMLRKVFANNPRVYVYDFIGENPYMGLLALADAIVVTNDSNNMMSEAYATGKPIYILPLPGHMDTKPARFAGRMMADGIARPLGDKIEHWTYPVDPEMERLAADVKRRMGL